MILAGSWLLRRTRPHLGGSTHVLAALCATWIVVYAVFYAFWDPLNIELWYVVWIPAAILLGLAAAAARPRRLVVVAATAFVALLFAVNLFGSLLPQRANARDYWRNRAQWYVRHLHHDDLLISYDYLWSSYLSYLTHGHVVDAQALFKQMPRQVAARRVLRIAGDVKRSRTSTSAATTSIRARATRPPATTASTPARTPPCCAACCSRRRTSWR